MKNRAFTLVELLVVVAIIVALLAILLPSMGRAIEIAQIAVCASNQHQLHSGVLSYASDGFGKLPLLRDDNHVQTVNHWSRWLFEPSVNRPYNLGFLWTGSYIHTGEVFYCPSQPHAAWQFETYADPVFPTVKLPYSGWGNGVRIGYNYNPVTGPDTTRDATSVLTMTQETIIVVDLLEFPDSIAHESYDAWNVTGGDGAVSFVRDATITDDIISAAGVGGTGASQYAVFDDILERLRR